MSDQIKKLVAALRATGLDPTSEEVADLIWLAHRMDVARAGSYPVIRDMRAR